MTSRIPILAGISLLAAVLMSAPVRVHGQPAAQAQHEHHAETTDQQPAHPADPQAPMMKMMAVMRANDRKLDELVAKMNAAQGGAKVDAIAELLTALVQDRKAMHDSMAHTPMAGRD